MADTLRDRTAIAGIGATEFSKDSGRTELQLAAECVTAALDDAGLEPGDVDGLCTFTMDTNPPGELLRMIGGKELTFFSQVGFGGGGGAGVVQQAAMAVATGVADVVVCYRAMNERSGARFGQPMHQSRPTPEHLLWSHHTMHGLATPPAFMALAMRRYMHETGATPDDFAHVAIAMRKHAATNPKAWYYQRPITLEDYHASQMVADPLRRADCCQESDGGVALVVVSAERARDLKQPPVLIRAAASGATRGTHAMTNYYRPDISPRDESRVVARQLYAMADLRPADMQVAILYDHFGPALLPALEAFGFCADGEAKDYVKDGAIELGGRLPVNPNGGQLGEAYIHGMNGFAEAVRQLRGTAVNQVTGVEHILATSGNATPTSAMILGRA